MANTDAQILTRGCVKDDELACPTDHEPSHFTERNGASADPAPAAFACPLPTVGANSKSIHASNDTSQRQ